eukprot:50801_1
MCPSPSTRNPPTRGLFFRVRSFCSAESSRSTRGRACCSPIDMWPMRTAIAYTDAFPPAWTQHSPSSATIRETETASVAEKLSGKGSELRKAIGLEKKSLLNVEEEIRECRDNIVIPVHASKAKTSV